MRLLPPLKLATVLIVSVLLAACSGAPVRLNSSEQAAVTMMMTDLGQARVVFVGEFHDQRDHHLLQLEVIKALHRQGKSLAIGLEMFQTDNQKYLDDWTEGRITEEGFKAVYARNWSYDWSLYRDIFIFARDNRIPLIALNIPKEIVFKVRQQGFASLTPEERKNLPSGVTCDLNKPQTELLKRSFEEVSNHEAKGKTFTSFCEAQAVRNNGMAMNIANDQKRHPGRKLVALAGIWHAVKHGVPERLAGTGSLEYRVILPEIAEQGPRNTTSALTDYLIGW